MLFILLLDVVHFVIRQNAVHFVIRLDIIDCIQLTEFEDILKVFRRMQMSIFNFNFFIKKKTTTKKTNPKSQKTPKF